jgi:hypothetical protein
MGRTPIAALGGLLLCVLTLSMAAAPAGAATARSELARLHASGAIDDAAFDRYRSIYDAAQVSAKRLSGRRRIELRAVINQVDSVAAAGRLTAARLPLAFLTIANNRTWWTTGGLLAYGQRVFFKGSDLVWQEYPGQGIQVQWLATFGRANALWTGGYNDRLKALLAQAAQLASPRAGGIAWEYWFRFDGGSPPWVSGLAQGTAIQAYSRAAIRLGDPALFTTARSALGIFQQSSPTGVRLVTPAGAHYLIYSFAPRLHVLNAFVQSLNGLHDFAKFANDDPARALFAAGEAEARVEVPKYDTGSWSLYSQTRESDLGYHKLLRDFIQGLCDRLTEDRDKPQPDTQTGGVPAGAPVATPPDPAVYCQTAANFTKDMTTAPKVALRAARPGRLRVRHLVHVPYTLSKISTVTTRVTQGGAFVAGRVTHVGRGLHEVVFTPRKPGPYAVSVRAVDPAGNAGSASGAVTVK